MVLLKLLIFTLTFYKLIVVLDAKICPKGQKVSKYGGCEACPTGHFQPEENDSQRCKVCTRCDKRAGITVAGCTAQTDTKCKCSEGFVPWVKDPASCQCPIGFGLIQEDKVKCSKCQNGYFSETIDSRCKKWKQCQFGVNVTGTDKSDVTCNVEQRSNTGITTAPTSNKITSLIKHLRTLRPHEGAQTQEINQGTTTTTTTTAAPRHTVTSRTPSHSSNIGNHIGMILLIFGIFGLLVLTAVTSSDPLCRRPVEESGDDSLSSLKLNPGKP